MRTSACAATVENKAVTAAPKRTALFVQSKRFAPKIVLLKDSPVGVLLDASLHVDFNPGFSFVPPALYEGFRMHRLPNPGSLRPQHILTA